MTFGFVFQGIGTRRRHKVLPRPKRVSITTVALKVGVSPSDV